jgi:hypothetical protein
MQRMQRLLGVLWLGTNGDGIFKRFEPFERFLYKNDPDRRHAFSMFPAPATRRQGIPEF